MSDPFFAASMRLAHNIRFTTYSKTPGERERLKEAYRLWLDNPLEEHFDEEDLAEEGLDTLYGLTLWLRKARTCRTALEAFRDDMDSSEELAEEAPTRLDERSRFWFRLDKQAFLDGHLVKAEKGDVIQVRINFAAFPKNPENVIAAAEQAFARKD